MIVAAIKSAVKFLGNDELHPQDLNALDTAITFAGRASSCREAAVMDVKMMK